jgi:hypothetical protein
MATVQNDRLIRLYAVNPRVTPEAAVGGVYGSSLYPDLADAGWTHALGGSTVVAVTDGPSGATARRCTAGVATYLSHATAYTIDRSRTYRVRFYARASATATGLLYFDLRQFLADGVTAGPGNNGRQPYKPLAQPAANTRNWTLFDYTWTNADWQVGVTQVRPDFLLNYLDVGTPVGYWEVQDFQMMDVTEVATAQATATAAAEQALAANEALTTIANDNVLSKGEKSAIILQWQAIDNEVPDIVSKAAALGVSSASYSDAKIALDSYLNAIPSGWSTLTADSVIDGPTFRDKFAAYYKQRQLLLNAIAAKTATLSTWSGTTGSLKPGASRGSAINVDPALENLAAWTTTAGVVFNATSSTAAGAVGGAYFYAQGAVGDNLYAYENNRYAVDPAGVYALTANLFASAGNTRNMYLFVNFYDYQGTQIGTAWGGAMSGYVYGSTPAVDTWTRCGADFGPNTGRPIPAGAKMMAIGVWFRYNNGTSTSLQAAQDIRLENVTAARAAKAIADAAAIQATNANNALIAIADDNILSKSEKPEIILKWAAITGENGDIMNKADAVSVSRVAYQAALEALASYLTAIPSGWNTLTADSVIDGPTFRTKFAAYYDQRQLLLNAIAAKAATTASWTGVAQRPADIDIFNNQDSIIRAPQGALLTTQSPSLTGSIKIRLPVSWTDTMMKFSVDIYEYAAGYSCSLEIAGYNYSQGVWYNVSARVVGGSNVEYPVYFGHDGTKCCVWIGTAGTVWEYPQVRVRDFFAGYGGMAKANWEAGWQISVSNAGPQAVTAQVLDTYPAADWSKIPNANGKPANNATVGAPAGTLVAGTLAETVAAQAAAGNAAATAPQFTLTQLPFTALNFTASNSTWAAGSYTATPNNAAAGTVKYNWSLEGAGNTVLWISSASNVQTVSLSARSNVSGTELDFFLTCTAVDAKGKTAIMTFNIFVDFA